MPRPERANNRRVDGWRLCYTLLDTEDLAVLDSCPDVIDSIPKLMRDEKNIEDGYASEQGIPREVEIQRIIQAIPDNTQKYQRYLELSSRPRLADIAFTIPRRRW